jgi:hypothetical protein
MLPKLLEPASGANEKRCRFSLTYETYFLLLMQPLQSSKLIHGKTSVTLTGGLLYFAGMNGKRISVLVLFLGMSACLSGYLMSKASFVGKLGMTYIYKEYRFLKTWWKGALAVFVIWIVLLVIQTIVERKLSKTKATAVHVIFIILALAGLYFTYSDFQHTTSHRWLKEKFHIGAYIFWLGWIIISTFSIVQTRDDRGRLNSIPA